MDDSRAFLVFEELGFFEPSALLLRRVRPSGKSVTDFLRERETHARAAERNYRDLSAALRDLDISNREARGDLFCGTIFMDMIRFTIGSSGQ